MKKITQRSLRNDKLNSIPSFLYLNNNKEPVYVPYAIMKHKKFTDKKYGNKTQMLKDALNSVNVEYDFIFQSS